VCHGCEATSLSIISMLTIFIEEGREEEEEEEEEKEAE
jgi:hypothetical protein